MTTTATEVLYSICDRVYAEDLLPAIDARHPDGLAFARETLHLALTTAGCPVRPGWQYAQGFYEGFLLNRQNAIASIAAVGEAELAKALRDSIRAAVK